MKRHIVIGLAILTLILLIEGNASTLPTAQAKIIGDDAATTAALEQCGELYSQPGDDPGGLWANISDPASRVVHVTFLSVPEILGTGTRTHPLGNRESQIFWDHTHPTGVVQAAWAEGLIAVAPGPTTLALVALGLGVFFFAGRRQGG